MKKKWKECPRHGITLFRCKRHSYKSGSSKKDKGYNSHYVEQCFKCLTEGKYRKGVTLEVKKKHISVK